MLAAPIMSEPASPHGFVPLPGSVANEVAGLRPAVSALAAAILRAPVDHPDVQDCASEATRRMVEGATRLHDGQPLRPYLLGIARHVALDMLRVRVRQHRRFLRAAQSTDDATSANPLDQVPDPGPGADESLETLRRRRCVEQALAQLDESPRRALVMFHAQGMGYQEIASELGVPLGTVATWITRSRKRLAELLHPHAGEMP